MLINKVTTGYVIQTFDTELKRFIKQKFIAGDECSYETESGEAVESELLEVNGEEVYLPFKMLQPS